MRALILFLFVCTSAIATGQSVDVGKQIYSSSQDSVFLVYLNDASGSTTALGSAFLVKPHILITNAHVAEAGSPVLAVGPVRIPVKVLRVDKGHDLAEMSVDVDLTSKPLSLSSEEVKPGEQIFAIGNPEGLEKTISQGIVSGLRKRDGADLIQISSPISHGSSGGPILNLKGEVVGVTVAFLEQGQNLNFAVPVEYVKALLDSKVEPRVPLDTTKSLSRVKELLDQKAKTKYSDEPDSEYRKLSDQILELLQGILKSTASPSALAQVACFGTHDMDLSDLGIEAARKLVTEKPTSDNQALLAYVLFDRAQDEGIAASFSDADSNEQKEARARQEAFLVQATATASSTVQGARGNALLLADYVLGSAKDSRGEVADAITLHARVASSDTHICETDLTQLAIRRLITENATAKRPEEAEKWFKEYASRYTPDAYEWDAEGDRRSTVSDQVGAANAYEQAAQNSYYSYDYCYAAGAHYFRVPENADGVMEDGKLCLDASAKNTSKDNAKYFDQEVPLVYNYMAEILESRGVYQAALEYVKQSLQAKPDYSGAMSNEANIYFDMGRYSECESVENAAIRMTDGKFPFMQFRLGTCYFAQGNWTLAEHSFRIAAEADKTDAASAFNLGLSLLRQGSGADARIWFREALTRNPDKELREKIQSALQ